MSGLSYRCATCGSKLVMGYKEDGEYTLICPKCNKKENKK